MAGLYGAQKMVLQAIQDLPTDAAGFVTDTKIAQSTQIAPGDVRDWIEILEGQDYVNVARTTAGLSAAITAQGKLALGQYRPFPTAPASPAAITPADPRGGDQRQGLEVIDSSGNWVLLGDHFFEAKFVRQRGGILTVVIPSSGSEDDAAIQALRSPRRSGDSSIGYAHSNDALIVNIENIESESEGEGFDWIVTLKPKNLEYGGRATEMATEVNGRRYSADEIAELRARRILLNDPPPMAYDHRRFHEGSLLESLIRGTGVPLPAERCILHVLYQGLRSDPALFLRQARLAAIFALKAGDVVERVERLSLGPIRDGQVHVAFAGLRRKKYDNRDPHRIVIEGDCPIE